MPAARILPDTTVSSPPYFVAKNVVTFWVDGDPQPQGSKTAMQTRTGRIVVLEGRRAPARHAFTAWRIAVAAAARAEWATHGCLDGPLTVSLLFALRRPPSVTRPFPLGPPDLDKLCRAVCDGIAEGGLIQNDARIVELSAAKVYAGPRQVCATPGVLVTLGVLRQEEAP